MGKSSSVKSGKTRSGASSRSRKAPRVAARQASPRDRRRTAAAPDQIKVSVIGNRLDAIS